MVVGVDKVVVVEVVVHREVVKDNKEEELVL
jgi:hypothetical protein